MSEKVQESLEVQVINHIIDITQPNTRANANAANSLKFILENIPVHSVDQNYYVGSIGYYEVFAEITQTRLMKNNIMYINRVSVCSKLKHNGIGSKMLSKAEEIARSNNCKYVYLQPLRDSIGFYKKNGYIYSWNPFDMHMYKTL